VAISNTISFLKPKFGLVLFICTLALPALAKEKFKVCTATLNSSDEREAFKKNLGTKNFEFVELTDFAKGTNKDDRGSEWFTKACESGIQCDVLVISGHFAGTFFGNKGFTLPADLLEEQSCQETCKGILNNSKEVFMFGCNTLATKETDSRTPEEYLQILLADNVALPDAERIVEARYGKLGTTMQSRMQRIFSGSENVYGFDAKAPAGAAVKSSLNNYFKKVGNYSEHLMNLEANRMVNQIDQANGKLQTPTNNIALSESLKDFSFTQCTGLQPTDPDYRFKKEICKLYDPNLPMEQKLEVVGQMLKNKQDRYAYLPSVSSFLRTEHNNIVGNPQYKSILQKIGSDQELKDDIAKLTKSLDHSITLKMDLLHVQWTLGWMDEPKFRSEAKKTLASTFKQLKPEDLDTICTMSYDGIYTADVTYEDLNAAALKTSVGPNLGSCIRTTDERITTEVLKGFKNPPKDSLYFMLWGLNKLPGHDAEILALSKKYADSKDPQIIATANSNIIYRTTNDNDRDDALIRILGAEGTQYLALQYLQESGYKSESVGSVATSRYVTKKDPDSGLAKAIAKTMPGYSEGWGPLTAKLGKASPAHNDILAQFLSLEHPNNPEISTWAINQSLRSPEPQPDYYAILGHAKLSPEQSQRLLDAISENPSTYKSSAYRYILKAQKHLNFSSDDKRVINNGPAEGFECTEGKDGMAECRLVSN
jgi:hypothetical protein